MLRFVILAGRIASDVVHEFERREFVPGNMEIRGVEMQDENGNPVVTLWLNDLDISPYGAYIMCEKLEALADYINKMNG